MAKRIAAKVARGSSYACARVWRYLDLIAWATLGIAASVTCGYYTASGDGTVGACCLIIAALALAGFHFAIECRKIRKDIEAAAIWVEERLKTKKEGEHDKTRFT